MRKRLLLSSCMIIIVLIFSTNLAFSQIRAIPIPSDKLGYPGENLSYTMGVGDFNGDGTLDFITRVWVDEVTPGQADNDFKTITYAFLNDGTFLWEFHHNLCPNDIGGDPCWTVTLSVWDFDGDGRDEVITQLKDGDQIKLVMLEGMTGRIKKSRILSNPRPRRNTHATVAYLNGWNNSPYFVYSYGDSRYRMHVIAFDKDLNEYWRFDGSKYSPLANWFKPYSWCNIYTSDFDMDHRDEIIDGPLLIDDDGSLYLDGTKWYRPHIGGAERSYIADIDPRNPGLEWFLIRVGHDPLDKYYVQPNYWKGPYLIDVDRKQIIWHHNTHEEGLGWGRLHHGWVGEIDERSPGLELWAKGNYFEGTEWQDILAGKYGPLPKPKSMHIPGYSEKWILYAADGTILKKKVGYYVGNPVYWDDDDESAEYYHYRSGTLYKSFDGPKLKANFPRSYGNGECTQADIMGDWREELLFASKYTLYLFGDTSPSKYPNRPSLRTDHNYRMNLASIATGLPKVLMRDFNLGNNPPVLNIGKLAFITPTRVVTANSVSDIISIQTQASVGLPVNVGENTTIILSSTSATGQFSLTAEPFVPITEVVMESGTNIINIYYRDNAIGEFTIRASETPDKNWVDATQTITIIETPQPPHISNFLPTHGQIGSVVNISGEHFSGATAVKFNFVPAIQFQVISDSSISATVPPGATTGPIIVETQAGTDTSDLEFIVDPGVAYAIRINCGGEQYTDRSGNIWVADQPYVQGSFGYLGGRNYRTRNRIANTDDDYLYQTEHYSMKYYRFTLPAPGTYRVKLLFAEIYYSAQDKRIFDVLIEGRPVLTNYDIFREVGHDVATDKIFDVKVNDNVLDINFMRIKDSPKISAIEITSAADVPQNYEISKLQIITPVRTSIVSELTDEIIVQTQSSIGTPVNATSDITLQFLTSSPTGEFSLNSDPFIPITTANITANTNQLRFFYRDSTAGDHDIEVAEMPDLGWQNATQVVHIVAQTEPPEIVSFEPQQGVPGTAVTITGLNFIGVLSVKFGGIDAANYIVNSETEISAVVPANATTGAIEVRTAAGTAISMDEFIIEQNSGPYIIRVNCGGEQYTDNDGNLWNADQAYQPGSWGYIGGRVFKTHHQIASTNEDVLFQSERYSMKYYKFTVPENGVYSVKLLFAEIYYNSPNKRKFSVKLERNIILNNYDIYAEAGHDHAITKEFTVEVNDRILDIQFMRLLDSPKISAIEVTKSVIGKKLRHQNDMDLSNSELPEDFYLSQNFPNPFNPNTELIMKIPYESNVEVEIFNQIGQRIKLLWSGRTDRGNYTLRWNATDDNGSPVRNGIYLCRMKTDRVVLTRKMIVLR